MTASHSGKAHTCRIGVERTSLSEGGSQVMSSSPKKMRLVKVLHVDPSVRRKQKKGSAKKVYVYSSGETCASMFERAFKL